MRDQKPTKAQTNAATAVRDYLNRNHLSIDDEQEFDDGMYVIETSDRDERDIYDEYPCQEIQDRFRTYARELRDLSPLVFVHTEEVDEWIHLTVKVRATPRQLKPQSISKLDEKLLEWLQSVEEIKNHERVTAITRRTYRVAYDGLAVETNVPGPYSGMFESADLTWTLLGNSVKGWELEVSWGSHSIKRPAKFKKLTPKIIQAQVEKIWEQLDQPMDCLGYFIFGKLENGNFAMTGRSNRSRPEDLPRYAVKDQTGKIRMPHNRGCVAVVFKNKLTGAEIELKAGDTVPEEISKSKQWNQ